MIDVRALKRAGIGKKTQKNGQLLQKNELFLPHFCVLFARFLQKNIRFPPLPAHLIDPFMRCYLLFLPIFTAITPEKPKIKA